MGKEFYYRLTFGNVIASTGKQLEELTLNQGDRTEISDGSNNYYMVLCGVKVNRKIYQPTEIEAELNLTQETTDAQNQKKTTAPKFSDIKGYLLQREVSLDIVDKEEKDKDGKPLTYNVAKNCYVYEMTPQLKRDVNGGTKMYVKLSIFSLDKLMTLNKYSKAYVARKLGSEILKPESLRFGTEKENEPLIKSDVSHLQHLKYAEGNRIYEFIQPYLVQYNESFYDFMVRTANRCGEFLYFEDGQLVLGLPDSTAQTIKDFESVTVVERSADPFTISAYARDSVKDGIGAVKGSDDAKKEEGGASIELNQSAIDKQDTGFPKDAFPDHTSSNAELAHDDFIFPLYKDKFSDIKREMFYDGNAGQIVAARLIPFAKTMLANEKSGTEILGTLASAIIVGEGVTAGLAFKQALAVNGEKGKQYMEPLKEKKEQYNEEKAVQFGTLNNEGWTTINYYNDILKHEEEQQRQIVCIDLGTRFIDLKLGQKIKVESFDDEYVIIQIQQISEEKWDNDYERYDTVADDKYAGTRSLKIYAIPGYNKQFIPPVHPVPVVRKVGPQTAFVTDNEDPKYQGRVRIAFPWQSLGCPEKKEELEQLKTDLDEVKKTFLELEAKEKELLTKSTRTNAFIEELKNYVNATKEEREAMLQRKKARIEELKNQLDPKINSIGDAINTFGNTVSSSFEYAFTKDKSKYIADLEKKKKDKEDEKKRLEEEIPELEAAAKEHDQKKGYADYKDVENDNTVICRYKTTYKKENQEYLQTLAEFQKTKEKKDTKEKVYDQLVAYIDGNVKAMSTPWVRIVTPMATPGGGTFFRPRVGDEVLVNFENDNIERPYVVGSVFSKNTLTPDEGLYRKAAPEMQWKNISMSMMSPNGHHITFTDPGKGGSFLTNLISPGLGFYGSTLGFNDMILGEKGGKNAKDLAGGIHIGDRYGMYEIQMRSEKRAIDIRSPFGTVSINAFSGITISAPNGNVNIKGKNITLEAGNKINLLSGKNIADPGIGDPEGKANKFGKVVTGIVGGVLGAVTDQFVSSVVDLSYIRHVVEVFVRPVDGTLKLKSKRYLMLEAGKGNATIRRDRYAKAVEEKKESQEEFYKALLTCVKFINEKVDLFYDTYETLWIDGYKKKTEYLEKAGWVLKDKKDPNLAEIASKANKWDDQKITVDTFENYFAECGILFDEGENHQKTTTDPNIKFNYLKNSAKAFGESAFKMYQHIGSFDHFLNGGLDLPLGKFQWMDNSFSIALIDVDTKSLWAKSWNAVFNDGNQDKLFNDLDPNPKADKFAMQNKKLYKRRLLLAFVNEVAHSPQNVLNKYMECNLKMDKVLTSNSLQQEYYWNRTVLNLDRDSKLQTHSFWRTVLDNTALAVWNKLKSNFAPFDTKIWNDKADGQILFSDHENSTLNFEGEGVHEENSSNIGTLTHLKKELMAIK